MKSLFPALFSIFCLILANTTFAAESGTVDQQGKMLHDKLCISCHTGMFGGDGSGIYTRKDRRVQSLACLKNQVEGCNQNLGFNLTEAQLASILAYLDQTYYKFDNKRGSDKR